MESIAYYAQKAKALKQIKPTQILCNYDIKKYFVLDNFEEFRNLILRTKENASFYEFIPVDKPVNLFMDIEIYKDKTPEEFENHIEIVKDIIQRIKNNKSQARLKVVVLNSHSETKRSYHIIFKGIGFENVKKIKPFIFEAFPALCKKKIVDTSVYREGLFRTYLSTKSGECRPLVKDNVLSNDFEFLDTFVTLCLYNIKIEIENQNENENESAPIQDDTDENDKKIIRKFIRKNYRFRDKEIRDIFVNHTHNCINVNLFETFCHNVDKEHKSNHQYIVIDSHSARQKCHDSECKDFKLNEISIKRFPKELTDIILRCLKVNKQEHELIEFATKECKDYITTNFDEDIDDIEFDRNEMVFKGNASNNSMIVINGKCQTCRLEHHINNSGYCLKCSVCSTIYPKSQLIPVDEKYKNLNRFWVSYNQLINNGTMNININNYYGGEEEFSCDIQLDNSIFKNKELTNLYNQILDGHKVVLVSDLLSRVEQDFKYTNGIWFGFNGSIWKQDKESLELRKKILKLSKNFNRIQHFYESKKAGDASNSNIIKNIKSLVNKLHKTGFEDEIIKGAKMYYNDESFVSLLNSKKHLVPFSNGVFDLLENKFRPTKKEDYVNLTCSFDYDSKVMNPEVVDFINKILPKKEVREYVLKKMSECLNGDIPNTNFLMFIGDGANGKSQLLNLMKLVMGELGEKVEVTLLTRKRNNANESNCEKIKLMYKRFAFLSEPEDGEKINIGLLKELTGSEEIVARGLYQESISFVMEAKLFLACNDLPEIKGEDTALWRRIRVVDFPSRFVDEPRNVPFEYKIDRTLPSRMREDVTWKQTFANILLDYYYRDIREPADVQMKTNEYRDENAPFQGWLDENIMLEESSIVTLKEICLLFYQKEIDKRHKNRVKKEVETWISKKFPNIDYLCKESRHNNMKYNGWKGISICDDI